MSSHVLVRVVAVAADAVLTWSVLQNVEDFYM